MAEQVVKMEAEANDANKLPLPETKGDPKRHGSTAEDSMAAQKLHTDMPAVPEGVGVAALPSEIKVGKQAY